MPRWPLAEPVTERRVALAVVVVFLVAGSAWIVFTDLLLYSLVHDPVVIARFETAKGWVFVLLAALLIYSVTLRSAKQLTKASRAISAILESIGDGVLLLGPDRTIAYANPASIQMLGVATPDDLRGMGAPEFSRRFHVSYPDGRIVPPDQFVSQRVFEESGPIRYKAILSPPEHDEVVISCTAAAVRPEIGHPPHLVVSVMHDITATEHQDRLRNALFASAAHAIKTPLAVIKGASQLLSAEVPAHLRRSTRTIERQCGRIDRLAENLFTYSRFHSGTLQFYPAELDLGSLVDAVGEEVARLSREHDVDVQLVAHPRVRGDHERLLLALRNAIHAAARQSVPGGPVVVRLNRHGPDAEIDVSYQRDPAKEEAVDTPRPETEFDDAGVGRYVTAIIVQAHGGTVTEQTDCDRMTVRIQLPVILEEAA